jgi:hypothetical protein
LVYVFWWRIWRRMKEEIQMIQDLQIKNNVE